MNRWLSIEFENISQAESFRLSLNKQIFNNSDKTYFKIFTPKSKENKYRIFYIADEGNLIIDLLAKDFNLNNSDTPERNLITRVAGASNDRSWMFEQNDF